MWSFFVTFAFVFFISEVCKNVSSMWKLLLNLLMCDCVLQDVIYVMPESIIITVYWLLSTIVLVGEDIMEFYVVFCSLFLFICIV